MSEREFRDKIEEAVGFITEKFENADNLTKPVLCHSLRVGFSLYDGKYSEEIVLAGFLHDTIEDTNTTKDELVERFGRRVADIVWANSKDDTIEDKYERKILMVKNCITFGEDALIVKSADVLENYFYHNAIGWLPGVRYLNTICEIIFENIPDSFKDSLFSELKRVYMQYSEAGNDRK